MYGKAILILLTLLFLLYLWININEMIDNDDINKLTFILYENMHHDQIHFRVATLLKKTTLDNSINASDGIKARSDTPHTYPMYEINTLSGYHPIVFTDDTDDATTDNINPHFRYENGKIRIEDVVYVSGITDMAPYYCKNKEDTTNSEIDSFYYFPYSQTEQNIPQLFTTRIAVLTKVNSELQFTGDSFEIHVKNTKVVKLKYINDDEYNIISLGENDYQESLNNYFNISSDEKIIMYIYEGLDIDEEKYPIEQEPDIYKRLMNIKCGDIYKLFGARHNHSTSTQKFDYHPTWTYNFIIKHIGENIGVYKPNNSKNNKLLNILIGNEMFSKTDEDYDDTKSILVDYKFKNHIDSMKHNIIFFQYHINAHTNNNILDYITLDINNLSDSQDDIKNLTPDEIRLKFVTVLTGSTEKNNSPVHQTMDYGIDNIQELIYLFIIGDKKFIRIPYFLHMCSQGSDLIGILSTIILEKREEKMYISYTDVCRYKDESQKYLNSLPTEADLTAISVDRERKDTQTTLELDFVQ